MTSVVKYLGLLALLAMASGACAQVQVGDNLHMNASGLFSGGYSGDYGNQTSSDHGLNLGLNGTLRGD